MEKAIIAYENFYKKAIPFLIAIPLIIMTVVIVINTLGRKLLVPFPVTVELVEALLVVSVYFGVSMVAMERGHVNVTFLTENWSKKSRCVIDLFGNLLASAAFGYLTLSAWSLAFESVRILEFRLAVYNFPLWPFKCLFALGILLLFVQLLINSIKSAYLLAGRETYAGQSFEA